LKPLTPFRVPAHLWVVVAIPLCSPSLWAQRAHGPDQALASSVEELRQQVQELRAAVAEIKSQASEYRAENQELRKELERLHSAAAAPASDKSAEEVATADTSSSLEQRVSSVEETTQVLESQLRGQYQSKVESASKYRVRLSGLVLLNLFHNRGLVDNLDVPTWSIPLSVYGPSSSFGGTLRQSELGFEVFGPKLRGASTSGEVRFDFGGGFPTGMVDGVNTGLVRLRIADVRLDWEHTSVVAGQDRLFISPLAPTSFASLIFPSFAYSGNLWSWTPQLRIEHTVDLEGGQKLLLEGGILDNVTGEPTYTNRRQPLAGEGSGQPAYAGRVSWSKSVNDRPLGVGGSGYYSKQDWGFDREANGWAVAADLRIPLPAKFDLTGEVYRGRGVGGIGGGIGQSVLFSGDPANPSSRLRSLNAAGGWSQLKFTANPRLEFNLVYGMDNPFSTDIHAFSSPVGYYPVPLAANRSAMVNFIFRPRSDLLVSGEYRHLRTTTINALSTAEQVNLTMGVMF
jgi:regulator of replication initiation timing